MRCGSGVVDVGSWSSGVVEELQLADRVAEIARAHGIETALIGATALAFHRYVRGTQDIDLGVVVSDLRDLRTLDEALIAAGMKTRLTLPDSDDELGGVLRAWTDEDDEGDPIEPVEVVNFWNPHRPRRTPATPGIRDAEPVVGTHLRCVRLPHLIALKCGAAGRQDLADVVSLLERNPDADREEIRTLCKSYGLDVIDTLIAEADS